MPCWTRSTYNPSTYAVLDEKGLLDDERLASAASEHGLAVVRQNGRVTLRDRSGRMDAGTMERLVRQSYSRLTVEKGLRKHGFKVKKTVNAADGTVKLTVGR